MMVQAYQTSPQWLRRLWPPRQPSLAPARKPATRHLEIGEGQRGLSYDTLFGPYLADARQVTLTDPFIHQFYQVRNVMELLETIVRCRSANQPVAVHLITSGTQPQHTDKQAAFLQSVALAAPAMDITFTWEMATDLHDRSIVTDHGWKIVLGRGLDIFQWYDVNNAFDFANRLQGCRQLRGCMVTYIRTEQM